MSLTRLPSSLLSRSSAAARPLGRTLLLASTAALLCSPPAAAVGSPWRASLPAWQAPSQASRRAYAARSGPNTPHTPISRPLNGAYSTHGEGLPNTMERRLFLKRNGKDISFWHDIPLLSPQSTHEQLLFHYVNEIPKGTRPKLEIATKEKLNPIKQDVKKGKLRDFTYGDVPFNYGCLPQTWENPHETHPLTGRSGDNDPLDVVELSEEAIPTGAVRHVRVLGLLALLDEDETDWKLLALDAAHPLAPKIRNISELETHLPGSVERVRQWFRLYKTTDGKGENSFAFEGAAKDAGFAQGIIWETHASWAALCRGDVPKGELWVPETVPGAARGEEPQEE